MKVPVPGKVLQAIRAFDGDWYTLTMTAAKPKEGEDSVAPRRCLIEVYSPEGIWWAPCNVGKCQGPVDWSKVVVDLPRDVEYIVGETTPVMRAQWRIMAMTCVDAMFFESLEVNDDLVDALRGQAQNLRDIVKVAATADPVEHPRAHAWFVVCSWLLRTLESA